MFVTAEFRRAVTICSDEEISAQVIDAVYTIFDVDGDGHLSTEEFISIMKSRLKRGIRVCDHIPRGVESCVPLSIYRLLLTVAI